MDSIFLTDAVNLRHRLFENQEYFGGPLVFDPALSGRLAVLPPQARDELVDHLAARDRVGAAMPYWLMSQKERSARLIRIARWVGILPQ